MAEQHNAIEKGYETYNLKIKPVVITTVALLSVAVVSFVLMGVMLLALEKFEIYMAEDPPPMVVHQKPFRGLLIQAVPPAELAQVQAENQVALSNYGWVDKDAGVVHMPIDVAKTLVLKRGFPVRK